MLLDDPEQAAVLLAMPGGLGKRLPLPPGPDSEVLASRVGSRLRGLLTAPPEGSFVVLLAAAERQGVQAVGHGGVALVVVPADGSADGEAVASAAAEALVASALGPAAPAEPFAEPLLALAETLAHAGALALASLPPGLRPVSGWLEEAAARTALEAFAATVLSTETPWAARRAALAAARRPGGAPPALSQAAAGLLECLGSPGELAARPRALLDAWSRREGKGCPKMPRAVRRALADPAHAGLAPGAPRNEVEEVRAAARERLVAAGAVNPLPEGDFSPAEALAVAARARREGSAGLCAWLLVRSVPAQALTGCRDEEPHDGLLLSRALPGRGFEIAWVAGNGSHHPIVLWPHWVLAPTLCGEGGRVCFVDPRGVWSVALDGRTPPTLLTAGSFRQLAASPDRRRLAAARWPDAGVWLGDERGSRQLPVSAHAGLVWVDHEVLAAADGASIGLFSPTGEGRVAVLTAPATTAVAARAGALYLAEGGRSGPALVRVDLGTGQREHLTPAPGEVSSLHASPDGSLVVATSLGLWRWRAGETPRRFSDGLSVAP